uniref:Uncharacterized protein n=1 Tax=Anguilla anguilla TaxID=7936 RepID=A0A0E9P5H6_ANGAN
MWVSSRGAIWIVSSLYHYLCAIMPEKATVQ